MKLLYDLADAKEMGELFLEKVFGIFKISNLIENYKLYWLYTPLWLKMIELIMFLILDLYILPDFSKKCFVGYGKTFLEVKNNYPAIFWSVMIIDIIIATIPVWFLMIV